MLKSMRRTVVTALLVVLAVWLIFNGALFSAMKKPPAEFSAFMKHVPMPLMMATPFPPMWNRARGGHLAPGDLAPDFTLPTADKTATVQLSAFRDKRPVVLVFGSYT